MTREPQPSLPGGDDPRPSTAGTILLIDDEAFIRNALQLYFETMGFAVRAAESGESALQMFSAYGGIDVVLLDLVMPGMSGLEVLRELKKRDPGVEVVITTGCGSMGSAIEALRLGAFDYITKPIVNFDQEILPVVRQAIEGRAGAQRVSRGGPPSQGRGHGEKGRILEHLIALALEVNRSRPSGPTLVRIEEILFRDFGARGGIVLQRGVSGEFAPVYSWGFSGPVSLGNDHLPAMEASGPIRDGRLAFFPIQDLESGWLGISPEDLTGCRCFACIPLIAGGNLWGCLVLLLSRELPPMPENGFEDHTFQVLVPILTSALSGALGGSR